MYVAHISFLPFLVRSPALTSSKVHRTGTHRVRAPRHTWAWIEPQLDRYGITRLADVTGLDTIGIPVYQAVRPAGRTLSVAQGKGVTPLLAKVSAAMEAIEFWHAEHLAAPPETCTARSLGGVSYRWGAVALAPGSFVHDDLPLRWLIGHGLCTGSAVPVPFDLVRLDAVYREQWSPPLFAMSSNGLASGNTVAEATVHALCEVIERDASASGAAMPDDVRVRLDLASVTDADCRLMLGRFAAAEIWLEVFADTAVGGVPCFEARGRAGTAPHAFLGAGCHPDPAVALCRALTEAAQSRLTVIAGSRDDDERPYRSTISWREPRSATAHPNWTIATWETFTDRSASRPEDEVYALARVVEAATGHEPIRYVMPSPTDIPVVRVVAPGLRFRHIPPTVTNSTKPTSAPTSMWTGRQPETP
jgi:ribosomal protein S12 methylthiotransferase accessory factor